MLCILLVHRRRTVINSGMNWTLKGSNSEKPVHSFVDLKLIRYKYLSGLLYLQNVLLWKKLLTCQYTSIAYSETLSYQPPEPSLMKIDIKLSNTYNSNFQMNPMIGLCRS